MRPVWHRRSAQFGAFVGTNEPSQQNAKLRRDSATNHWHIWERLVTQIVQRSPLSLNRATEIRS